MSRQRSPIRLQSLAPNVFYWRRVSNGGLVDFRNRSGLLIDTGADKAVGPALLEEVRGRGWRNVWIVNTHRHHDHIAGNRLLVEELGARVWTGSPGPMLCDGEILADVYILALPGHTPDSIGIRTGPVFWAGDALMAPEILQRYVIPPYTDVAAALSSLGHLERYLSRNPVEWGVAGHGRPLHSTRFIETIYGNRQAVARALSFLNQLIERLQPPPPSSMLDPQLTRLWLQECGLSAPTDPNRFNYWRAIGSAYFRHLSR